MFNYSNNSIKQRKLQNHEQGETPHSISYNIVFRRELTIRHYLTYMGTTSKLLTEVNLPHKVLGNNKIMENEQKEGQ